MARDVIVFLGPSLPRDEARRIIAADFRPPARQGDVFRALADRPRVIALIDGVFESQPSVWHHELIAAAACGAHLLGASSMGALRAAELPGVVTPVGEIAKRYVAGAWNDDSHVALLHADEELGFRPMTVPFVNVWATAREAQKRKVLSRPLARELVFVAERFFFQDRTWRALLDELGWVGPLRSKFDTFLRRGAVDLKAADARLCLKAAAKLRGRARRAEPFASSSFVRRHRLTGTYANELAALAKRRDRDELEAAGTRRLLLAGFARAAGVTPDPSTVAAWLTRLAARRVAEDERVTLAEALALEEAVLSAPERFLTDGPSRLEGLVAEARLRGLWAR